MLKKLDSKVINQLKKKVTGVAAFQHMRRIRIMIRITIRISIISLSKVMMEG